MVDRVSDRSKVQRVQMRQESVEVPLEGNGAPFLRQGPERMLTHHNLPAYKILWNINLQLCSIIAFVFNNTR